jgi:FkbM family methyltransferase
MIILPLKAVTDAYIPMKSAIKYILHKLLGFRNYLFVFSVFKIYTLKWDRKENDFLFFLKMIPAGTVVLDIGANIGVMAVLLAKKIKGAQVVAFEPVPANISALKRVIGFFSLKNVRVMEYALGNEEGEVEMVMPVIDSVKMQGLSHVVHSSITENNEGVKVKAPIHRLDNITGLNGTMKISAVKIDVENFEYFVLEGGKSFINKYKPIIYIELWENDNRHKCFSLVKELGYKVNVVANEKLAEYDPSTHETQNFIFTPAG